MTAHSVVVFCMGEDGHFQRLRPLVSLLSRRGMPVYVFTDRRFGAQVEEAGGTFVDLFAAHPLEHADAESRPVPCRFVTFAGCYAEDVLREVEALEPRVVVYDTFAVIGRVVASALGVPYVNVCAGHNVDPERFVALLQTDPRVAVSRQCHRAVEVLRERFGLEDASPFSYVSALSPMLNVYCEPERYLTEAERQVFAPVAFFGSLPSREEIEERRRRAGTAAWFGDGASPLKVYVSFGTVVWRYYAREAIAALRAICGSLAARTDVRVIVSAGRADVETDVAQELSGTNVSVAAYVDQWQVLREADVFVTHHGLNSTHEAIVNRAPMISYPFFWDQPSLAAKCQRFGLAVPLTASVRGPVREEAVDATVAELSETREWRDRRLAEAAEWEWQVVEARESVVEKIVDLI